VIEIDTPLPHPVLVYIAAVPAEEDPTVTPELIVRSTLVLRSPPAPVVAEAIL
jgi:hypothetical protein